MTGTGTEAAALFEPLRPRLVRIAYRMLGSVADAEDIVQETFLRWLATDRGGVREPEAYLRRIVTRLSINQLKSARHRRETYIGPWLPEPVVEPEAGNDGETGSEADFTLPLMLALERLSPLERAAFLLHDVFGVGFDEIAATLGRSPAACRQLASRSRANIREARPRFPVPREHGKAIAAAFFAASRSGDIQTLRSLLAADVVAFADGGGRTMATAEPIVGLDAVVALHERLAAVFTRTASRLLRYGAINGLPGFVTVEQGDMLQTTALDIRDGRIAAIYVTQNPDKLRHIGASALH